MSHLCSQKLPRLRTALAVGQEKNHISSTPKACPLASHHPLRGLAACQLAPKVTQLSRKARSRPACRAPNPTERTTLQLWGPSSPAKLVQGGGSILASKPG